MIDISVDEIQERPSMDPEPKEQINKLRDDKQLDTFVRGMRAKSMVSKTQQIMNRFKEWLSTEHHEERNIDVMN